MFCKNCGKKVEDGAKFCYACGAKLPDGKEAEAQKAEAVSPADTQNVSVPATVEITLPDSVAIQTPPVPSAPIDDLPDAVKAHTKAEVKKLAKSGLFLLFAVLYSLVIILSIVSAISTSNGIYDIAMANLYEALNESFGGALGEGYYFVVENSENPAATLGSIIGSIGASIPSILVAVGIWLIYGSAMSKKNDSPTSTGFTMIKITMMVMMILGFALSGIGILLYVALLGILAFAAASVSVLSNMLLIVIGILLAVFSAVLAYLIVYYVKFFKTINALRNTAKTGVPSLRVSRFIIFNTFAAGGINLISGFVMIAYAVYWLPFAMQGLLGIVSSAMAFIIGILLIMFRKKMAQIKRDSDMIAAEAADITADEEF